MNGQTTTSEGPWPELHETSDRVTTSGAVVATGHIVGTEPDTVASANAVTRSR